MKEKQKNGLIEFETVAMKIHVSVDKICSTYAYVYSPTYAFAGERHEAWEIIYLSKGEATVETDDKSAVLKSGQIYIHKPFDFHKVKANNTTCNVGIISFHSKSKPLYEIADKAFNVTAYHSDLIIQIINEGMMFLAGKNCVPPLLENEKPEFAAGQVIKNLLELLLIDVLRTSKRKAEPTHVDAKTSNNKNLVQNVKCYLAKNVNTPLSLKGISNELNYSVSHICTCFKKETGISVMNYFTLLRIERAKKLITDGEKTIKEISEELNFDTLQYFSYQFKKHTGYSPSQYSSMIKTYKILDTKTPNKVSLLLNSKTAETDED
ncbi:MAG: helix-turn-helix transcriptional regulator [Clostridia bacterium]|nr:helix-turn-helix transcriptional regulator [Clostridia bacterium]